MGDGGGIISAVEIALKANKMAALVEAALEELFAVGFPENFDSGSDGCRGIRVGRHSIVGGSLSGSCRVGGNGNHSGC